jgi:hypothetical protein
MTLLLDRALQADIDSTKQEAELYGTLDDQQNTDIAKQGAPPVTVTASMYLKFEPRCRRVVAAARGRREGVAETGRGARLRRRRGDRAGGRGGGDK